MLVVLLGPSGVGKSAIIGRLLSEYNWTPLVSVVTRPARVGDAFKVSVSDDSYDMLRDIGKLWSDVAQGDYRYALLRSEVEVAIHSKKVFIVDFALDSWKQYFVNLEHVKIYLTAETQDALASRLKKAAREDRLESSLRSVEEFEEWFSTDVSATGAIRLLNLTDQLEDVVASIAAVVQDKMDVVD